MKKFLIINYTTPNTSATEIPYLWLTLKSYFQRNSIDPSAWHWLDPIHSSYADSEETLIKQIVDQSPDVIGISCYMWNDKLTLHIAEEVKRRLPNVKIIAGGPALYYEYNSSWFVNHWYIDVVCEYAGYGEVFITEPGTQRAIYCHDEVEWLTIHAVKSHVLEEIESVIFCNSFTEFDALIEDMRVAA